MSESMTLQNPKGSQLNSTGSVTHHYYMVYCICVGFIWFRMNGGQAEQQSNDSESFVFHTSSSTKSKEHLNKT